MRNKIIIVVVAVLILGSLIFVIAKPQQTELEKFCEVDPNYENFYDDFKEFHPLFEGFTDREFLAFSIANHVNLKIQYKESNYEKSIEEILEESYGDCDEHSTMISQCLTLYGFENAVARVPFAETHHTFNRVMIDGEERWLDGTLDEYSQFFLFEIKSGGQDYWDWVRSGGK